MRNGRTLRLPEPVCRQHRNYVAGKRTARTPFNLSPLPRRCKGEGAAGSRGRPGAALCWQIAFHPRRPEERKKACRPTVQARCFSRLETQLSGHSLEPEIISRTLFIHFTITAYISSIFLFGGTFSLFFFAGEPPQTLR